MTPTPKIKISEEILNDRANGLLTELRKDLHKQYSFHRVLLDSMNALDLEEDASNADAKDDATPQCTNVNAIIDTDSDKSSKNYKSDNKDTNSNKNNGNPQKKDKEVEEGTDKETDEKFNMNKNDAKELKLMKRAQVRFLFNDIEMHLY
ncbi:hypothetical protein HDU77_006866 [Chytriomyces hyalinus]|nr:hypothetical protein HDU77_006866 [Chytriomyces hyalinus]